MARIFIAIRLTEQFKQPLLDAQARLKELGVEGFYASKENLHLTLSFIGETDKVSIIKQAISEIEFEPFSIKTSQVGCFNSDRAKVLWMGVEESEQLQCLADKVRQKLTEYCIEFDQKPFKAHITLASRPSRFITEIEIPHSQMTVEKVSVMETVSMNGKPVFIER